jgi:phosphatidylethanolamine/phosphatidyl-N-methylethanolamine N-methyltransferase
VDIKAVEVSYARWAPVYDSTFGAVTNLTRRRSAEWISDQGGEVLEVGVGTGMALPFYRGNVQVTGIDYSPEMLAKAEAKVARQGLTRVKALRRMDARVLEFPDASFDTVAAMHVLSVVPEPEKVMTEMARVCRPGGRVVITNHFKREKGFLAALERATSGISDILGWHSDFAIETVLGEPDLEIELRRQMPPLGMMTFLVLRKRFV